MINGVKKNLFRPRHIDSMKESVRKSARVLFAWDSGSAIVLVSDLLMLTQAGTQCPGYTWKKYLPHRLNNSRATVFVSL